MCLEGRAGGSREAAVLSFPPQFGREGSLQWPRHISHPIPTLLWFEELSHSMGDGKISPFHSEFHTTGLLLENRPLENGRTCPFREEVYVWHMAGDTFLQPGWHKVITHPDSPEGAEFLPVQDFRCFLSLEMTTLRKQWENLNTPKHKREYSSNTFGKRSMLLQWVLCHSSFGFSNEILGAWTD